MYTYQGKENLVVVSGVDYESFRRLKPVEVVEGSERGFEARRDGALVGRPLANQYGWKVGDTVRLVEDRLTFAISGIFTSSDKGYETGVLLHKEYLGKLKRDEGKSTFLIVRLADPAAASAVSQSIDAELANSPKPTKTQSERAARERELQDFQEMRRMLGLMIIATVVVSVFGAANGVSMSVRERTREVGILRSLGLRKDHIMSIVIGEAVLVAVGGGAVGVGLAYVLLAADRTLGGMVPLAVPPANLAVAAGASLLVGLLGSLAPAVRATRLSIVDCLKLAD
jgi:putative ABC transport system permease protein